MKRTLSILLFISLFLIFPQFIHAASLSEVCFPAVKCANPTYDYYANDCKPRITTLASCPSGNNAFNCSKGCYYKASGPKLYCDDPAYAFKTDASGNYECGLVSDNDWKVKSNDDMYALPNGNVGIGTTDPKATLDVGLNFNTPALRLGWGTITQAIGNYSVAIGYLTEARGSYSFASGQVVKTNGIGAVAIGDNLNATNAYAMAFGSNNTASGLASLAAGYYNTAAGTSSIALGRNMNVTGHYSAGLNLSGSSSSTLSQNNTFSVMGGNVGIGTVTPNSKLHVDSGGASYAIRAYGSANGVFSESTRTAIQGFSTGTGNSGVGVYGEGNWAGVRAKSTGWGGYFEGKGYFSGNVGIGELNPSVKLDVNGDTKSNSFTFKPTSTAPSTVEGKMYYNDSENKLKYWDGLKWIAIPSASASGGSSGGIPYTSNPIKMAFVGSSGKSFTTTADILMLGYSGNAYSSGGSMASTLFEVKIGNYATTLEYIEYNDSDNYVFGESFSVPVRIPKGTTVTISTKQIENNKYPQPRSSMTNIYLLNFAVYYTDL